MPPKNRRMSLRFVFRDGIRYLCRHPSAPSPLFPEKRKPASRPEVLRFADPIRNGLPSPAPSAGAYPPRPNPVVAPIPTSSTLFYYGKTRKTRHPLHGHAARPRSECRRYPQVAHRPRFPGRPRLAPGGLYRPHPPGRQRRTARPQQRRPHGRSPTAPVVTTPPAVTSHTPEESPPTARPPATPALRSRKAPSNTTSGISSPGFPAQPS